jgi:hypothetical protein
MVLIIGVLWLRTLLNSFGIQLYGDLQGNFLLLLVISSDCGNPECYSLIAYYPNQMPSSCGRCGKEIDWE